MGAFMSLFDRSSGIKGKVLAALGGSTEVSRRKSLVSPSIEKACQKEMRPHLNIKNDDGSTRLLPPIEQQRFQIKCMYKKLQEKGISLTDLTEHGGEKGAVVVRLIEAATSADQDLLSKVQKDVENEMKNAEGFHGNYFVPAANSFNQPDNFYFTDSSLGSIFANPAIL